VLLGCGVGKAESNGICCSGSHPSAIAQGRLSRKAREVAHPQLFRSMLKDKPELYFAFKVAHPATYQIVGDLIQPLVSVVRTVDEALAALGVQSSHFEPLEQPQVM